MIKKYGYSLLLAIAVACLPIGSGASGSLSEFEQKAIREAGWHHVLLFKWKASAGQDQIDSLHRLWMGLRQKIEGFRKFGNARLESGEYDEVVMLEFDSRDAYANYQQHADHREIARRGPALVEKFAEYSYWK